MRFKWILFFGLPFFGNCSNVFRGQVIDGGGKLVVSREGRVNIINLQVAGDPGKMVLIREGHFEFNGELDPGRYLVETLIPGYETVSRKLQLPTEKFLQINTKLLAKPKIQPIGTYEKPHLSDGSGTVTLTPPKF